MDDIYKVQKIGELVCEGCSDDHRDCGIDPEECDRILEAVDILNEVRIDEG